MRQRTQLALVAITTLAIATGGVVTAVVLDDGSPASADSSDALAFTAPGAAAAPSPTPSTSPSRAPSTPPSTSPRRTMASPAATRPTVTPAAVAPAPQPPAAEPTVAAQVAPISYTVKSGDTLSDIAAWFALNGYTGLFEANRAVIGSNPDLIRPGQVFTISGGQLQMPQG